MRTPYYISRCSGIFGSEAARDLSPCPRHNSCLRHLLFVGDPIEREPEMKHCIEYTGFLPLDAFDEKEE